MNEDNLNFFNEYYISANAFDQNNNENLVSTATNNLFAYTNNNKIEQQFYNNYLNSGGYQQLEVDSPFDAGFLCTFILIK